jgi:bifunctional lysine-specific demethylase and histidyl-hydroxylase NO66
MQPEGSGAAPTRESTPGSALRRCLSVDPATFAARYWDREALLATGVGDFTDLLNLADVDELLSRRGLRTPFLRIAKQGTLIDPAQFTGGGGVGAEVGDQVRDERLFQLYLGGATLVLQGLHRLWPALIEFAVDLRRDLGTPVQINAYLTPPESQGFATHYDTHAVLVLQVAGRKHWRVHRPVVTDPIERQAWGGHADEVAGTATAEPVIDTVLEPGDALYLPRGWLHAADARAEQSLHLTVGLRAPTRFTLVEALLDLAADEPSLRTGLPMGTDLADREAIGPALADTVKALHSWLDRVGPDEVATRLRPDCWAAGRPAPLAPIAQRVALDALTAESRVTLRRGLPCRLSSDRDGDRLVLRLPDREIAFPAPCADAVRRVLAGRPVRVGDLPGLEDDHDRLVLARRLLSEAVVTPEVGTTSPE